eukprot:6187655-Pleurochrysis_carterae.AAC.2
MVQALVSGSDCCGTSDNKRTSDMRDCQYSNAQVGLPAGGSSRAGRARCAAFVGSHSFCAAEADLSIAGAECTLCANAGGDAAETTR